MPARFASALVLGLVVLRHLVLGRIRIAGSRLVGAVRRIFVVLRPVGALVVFAGHVDLPFKTKPAARCFVREEHRYDR